MNIPVITVGADAGDHVAGLERLRGPVTVVRRCEELSELMAACQSGLARAAIFAPRAGELTLTMLERLRAAGVAVVALTDGTPQPHLDQLGVRQAPVSSTSEALAAVVASVVEDFVARPPERERAAGYSDLGAALQSVRTPESAGHELPGEGKIIAVWGPAGSPGRTTVAVNMAAELAAAGSTVLLIDADTYGASVAASLGLFDESAGLAQACRLADQGGFGTKELARVMTSVVIQGGRLGVLTGITRPDRWPELRPAALARVLDNARTSAAVTVIDCGFCLETDEELTFDTAAPRRNAAALRCLELADTVLAVGAADALGVPRLVRALAELREAIPTAVPKVVFNKVRAGSIGRSPERQLREAWDRFGSSHPITAFLPADFAAADKALLGGSALLETTPSSPLRAAIAGLADVPVEQRRRGRAGPRNNEVTFFGKPVSLPR
ncbi:P-loop NTPase [Arthrobacter sp. Br18]|uniref:AAA family ATPase n=1 Tax=Arthrobacter sp. Br18 TaxID=1312954 RepID=UPI0004BC5C5C|nr:P-loop NTPase [Arthrobacter sp. Br18]